MTETKSPSCDLEIDVAQDVKEFLLRQRIRAFDVFEFDQWFHDELSVAERDHRIGPRGARPERNWRANATAPSATVTKERGKIERADV